MNTERKLISKTGEVRLYRTNRGGGDFYKVDTPYALYEYRNKEAALRRFNELARNQVAK